MREIVFLVVLVTVAGAVGACGSHVPGGGSGFGSDNSGTPDAGLRGLDASVPLAVDASAFGFTGSAGDGGDAGGGEASMAEGMALSGVHIVPADAVLIVGAGSQITQAYKVMGVVDDAGPEVDVTQRFVFYVPDNYCSDSMKVAGFAVHSRADVFHLGHEEALHRQPDACGT